MASTAVVGVGVLAAASPFGRVLVGDDWLIGVVAVVGPVLGVGALARLTRWPGAALVAQLVTWAVAVTATQVRSDALLGIIPGPETVAWAASLVRRAMAEVVTGSSPLPVSEGLSFLVVAALGLIALIVDQVAVSGRTPFAAGLILVAVAIVPSIAVADQLDIVATIVVATAVLLLCAIEAGTRAGRAGTDARGWQRIVVVVVSGAVVLGLTVALVPIVPRTAPAFDLGRGATGTSISGTLRLGDDLRLPGSTEVLRVRTELPTYLRALTVTDLTATGWRADDIGDDDTVPLTDIPPAPTADGITVDERRAGIEITGLTSTRLPVPYPATSTSGLNDEWSFVDADRTVVGPVSSPGLTYDVTATVPQPTVDQLRAATAGGADPRALEIPAGAPDIIQAQAAAVTSRATTDYDRLIALQDWFRGDDFRYSLTAPSRLGYDDGGLAATADFLRQGEGYCVHFASAFTLMARTLGMPTRIVVGYLPGEPVADGGGMVRSVTNRQLHAWPEVHFADIGWVGFEPTQDVGEPGALASTAEPTPGSSEPVPTTTPSAAFTVPAPTASGPAASPPPTVAPTVVGSRPAFDVPLIGLVLLGLVVLVLPAAIRAVRDTRDLRRARTGGVGAAWRLMRRRAVDLGIPVAASDSPRAVGGALVRRGAPPSVTDRLVATVETAAYGPGTSISRPEAAADALSVRRAITVGAHPLRRLLAFVLPRSSFRRESGRPERTG